MAFRSGALCGRGRVDYDWTADRHVAAVAPLRDDFILRGLTDRSAKDTHIPIIWRRESRWPRSYSPTCHPGHLVALWTSESAFTHFGMERWMTIPSRTLRRCIACLSRLRQPLSRTTAPMPMIKLQATANPSLKRHLAWGDGSLVVTHLAVAECNRSLGLPRPCLASRHQLLLPTWRLQT